MSDRTHGKQQVDQAQARAFLEGAPIGIVIADAQGTIRSSNAYAEDIFGYGPGELDGQPVETLIPERLRDLHVRHRSGYFAAPRSRPMGMGLDLVGRRADGSELPIEVSLSFVPTPEGGRAIAFISDITRRRDAERRLQTEFAVTRALLAAPSLEDAAPPIVRAVCEFLGWEAGELWLPHGAGLRWHGLWSAPGVETARLERVSRDLVIPVSEGLAGRAWRHGEPSFVTEPLSDTRIERREAIEALDVRAVLGVPIRDDQQVVGVMLFFSRSDRRPDDALLAMLTDIGRRIGSYIQSRRVREELSRQKEILYRTERLASLGTLIAGLVHELNNPLGIVSSRIEIMLMEAADQGLPQRAIDDLGVIHRNIQRVAGLAQALGAFSRQSPQPQAPVRLNDIVDETLLLVRKTFSTDGIEIATELDPALPPVLGNASALGQVLLNLITNAREAMAAGGGIRVVTDTAPGTTRVRLTVADTGPGIPDDVRSRIFDPFFTTKPSGTGLGLSVSYGIVQDHGGTMDVESRPGHGATFVLTFPALGAD